jgi:tartrate dehydrogenase/decarboxylase / D-malate dehydrogenase
VIVASNLFGDILSDLGVVIMGSIGIANPIGQIWTAKMMLDHFGENELGNKF